MLGQPASTGGPPTRVLDIPRGGIAGATLGPGAPARRKEIHAVSCLLDDHASKNDAIITISTHPPPHWAGERRAEPKLTTEYLPW